MQLLIAVTGALFPAAPEMKIDETHNLAPKLDETDKRETKNTNLEPNVNAGDGIRIGRVKQAQEKILKRVDSTDTLADMDQDLPEMRTCDGSCGGLFDVRDLRISKCCRHAICQSCWEEMTVILADTGRPLCPIPPCRYGSIDRNRVSMKEYRFVKRMLHWRNSELITNRPPMNQSKQLNTKNSEAEISLSLPQVNVPASESDTHPVISINENHRLGSWISLDGENCESLTDVSSTDPCSGSSTTCSTCGDELTEDSEDENERFVTAYDFTRVKSQKQVCRPFNSPRPINADDYPPELLEQLQMLSCSTANGFEDYWQEVFANLSGCETAEPFFPDNELDIE